MNILLTKTRFGTWQCRLEWSYWKEDRLITKQMNSQEESTIRNALLRASALVEMIEACPEQVDEILKLSAEVRVE